jgi:hypothetical protein
LTPESRVLMELSRSCREDCSEVTDEAKEEVIVSCWCKLYRSDDATVESIDDCLLCTIGTVGLKRPTALPKEV